MPKVSIIIGVVMTLIGFAGMYVAISNGKKPSTAAIPVAIGVIIVLCGVISGFKDSLRKHLMHVSLLLALIGLSGILFRWISAGTFSKPDFSPTDGAFLVQASFVTTSVVFIVLGIKSFIDARSK